MKTDLILIGVPLETKSEERRVAATPETVKKMIGLGCQVLIQKGAGERACITDAAYQVVGAEIVSAKEVFKADLILKVRAPEASEIKAMQADTVLIGMLEPFNLPQLNAMAAQGRINTSVSLRQVFCRKLSNGSLAGTNSA